MVGHSPQTNEEFLSDILVAFTRRHQSQHLNLAPGQAIWINLGGGLRSSDSVEPFGDPPLEGNHTQLFGDS